MRKAALVAHVCMSVGWLGAVAVFLALAVSALGSRDEVIVRAGYVAMDVATRYVIVPLAIAALATGLLSSLGTTWGLVRHWWVLIKLALIVVATAVLLAQLGPIGALADAVTGAGLAGEQWRRARVSLVVHSGGGLLVLFAATVLAVYKPRGLTRYGHRRTARGPRR
ncbi:DUF2269 domain-containing protein [Actinoplanes sp. NPDC051346]|uniref:DUF2269 domain-containing protein n=1 Tax=Actinoplanes sp. NPDC051346 TaxID=3155048 RepID=UPI0034334CA7